MRAQPLHKGHEALIQQIIDRGYQPILVLGETINSVLTERNPWDYHSRHCMIHHRYPGIPMAKLSDATSWDQWAINLQQVISMVTAVHGEPVIALHNKPEDLQSFTFHGIDYIDSYYSTIFDVLGVNTINLEPTGINIRATTIRSDIETNRDYLSEPIYNYIKD